MDLRVLLVQDWTMILLIVELGGCHVAICPQDGGGLVHTDPFHQSKTINYRSTESLNKAGIADGRQMTDRIRISSSIGSIQEQTALRQILSNSNSTYCK